jgi:hypothetical protein
VNVQDVARKFDAKPVGSGYKACCPAHEDDKASLSIKQMGDKVLVKCFAGCGTEHVLRAVGLTMRDLFVSSNGHKSTSIVATYEYRDLHGVVCYRKQRTADKEFWFEKPNGQGGWTKGIRGIARHVYRRNELAGNAAVFIAEGEKDVDRLWAHNLPATTNDAGASQDLQTPKWTDALTQQLKAIGVSDVICLPDNDDPGRTHMQAVAKSCLEAGIAAKIVALADLPEHGDVSDWLDAGHTHIELLALADATALYTPVDIPDTRPTPIVAEPRTLAEVHGVFVHYLGDDYDLDALDVMLAAAAAEQLGGDPAWLLLISGPGNAKTETVQALSGVGAITVSTITSEGALLSASPKRERTKDATGGLLRQVGERGIVVVKDMTSILSMQSNTRAGLLAALREIHDGKWVRNVGTEGGKTLTWAGRVVVIGACTTAWDTHHTVIATMGDRFVLLRMNSHDGRESAGRHAIHNTGSEVAMRTAMAESVAGLLGTVDPQHAATLTEVQVDSLLAAANIATLCRTGVEYDYHGYATEAHAPEMPTRFAKQLTQVIRGGVAIGMPPEDAMRLAVRCARDSMPPLRLKIMADLWKHPHSLVEEVRARLDMPYMTVKKQVDSLHLLQVLTCMESQEQHEESVVVEAEAKDESATKTKRTMKKRTIKRYCVVSTLEAASLGLQDAKAEKVDELGF